ncbi:DUF6089 family protein [Sporocytophaga myxococcoides]|uniref:type IX secretion system protein PorG n=1 Tax=Sporocytophaga myxococcoides TaxID=153721 RepID=UPI00041643F9|nr:DUF6089 family protein [Sporocytophaga myxococcoides]
MNRKNNRIAGRILSAIFLFIGVSVANVNAQVHEIGLGAGGFNYTGELARKFNPLFYRPGAEIFYRLNFSPAVALRGAFSFGGIYGAELKSKDPVANYRQGEFKNNLTEVSATLEYNFFNFRAPKDSRKAQSSSRITPYFTGGIAFYNTQQDLGTGNSFFNVAIPIGLGFKYQLTEHWNLGGEFVARKTFTDYLDGVREGTINYRRTGDILKTDWYYYTGLTVSYTFYSVKCPAIYHK